MIDNKERARECLRQERKALHKWGFFWPFYAMASFFMPFWFRREPEPFTLPEPAPTQITSQSYLPPPGTPNRFSGFVYKRVKKCGNFFAYAWVRAGKAGAV